MHGDLLTEPAEETAMVWEMDEIEPSVVAATWERKAQCDGLRCRACAMTIPYGNCETYYRTRMCGYCAHQAEIQ
jgi:hypothetical protein